MKVRRTQLSFTSEIQILLPVTMGRYYLTHSGKQVAGKSFRFTRTPKNVSQHLPELWTTSSVQLIEINLLYDLLEIMSWPHLFNYIIAPNSSSSVIFSLYFPIATIHLADLFHCKSMLIRRSQNGTRPRITSFFSWFLQCHGKFSSPVELELMHLCGQ